MDSQGYIDLQILANFNRMKALCTDLEFIKSALQKSEIVELREDGKVRRREGWETWVLPNPSSSGAAPPPAATGKSSTAATAMSTSSPAATSSKSPQPPPQPSRPSASATGASSIPSTSSSKANGNNDNKNNNNAIAHDDDDGLFELEDEWIDGSRPNTVQKYYISDDEDEDEHDFDEDMVARIMIVTQRKRDRTHVPFERSKMNQDVSDMINEGLYQYESGLSEHNQKEAKVGTIDPEQFAQLSMNAKDNQGAQP